MPLSGRCDVFVETAYLDQRLSTLQPSQSTLAQMLAANPLADVLYAERPARLLLLDEPDNHLDLASVQRSTRCWRSTAARWSSSRTHAPARSRS